MKGITLKKSFKNFIKEFCFLQLTLLVIFLFASSCAFKGLNFDSIQTGGNAKKFIEDGFSLPVIEVANYKGEMPTVSNVAMFQTGATYTLNIPVLNPRELDLTYIITTDKPDFFPNSSGSVLLKGNSNIVHMNISLDFNLLTLADKKDMQFFLSLESSMRTYEINSFQPIHINTRPSSIVPLKNADRDQVENNTWEPVIIDNKATIYWDYSPSITDTDIKELKLSYTMEDEQSQIVIPYDSINHTFGTNSYTVDTPVIGSDITFKFEVFDDEGLGSGVIGSGDLQVYTSVIPVIALDSGNRNRVTITALDATYLYATVDSDEYQSVTSPYEVILTKEHRIRAFSKTSGKID